MATLNCPVCDEPFQPGDLLCMSCGANLARVGGAHRQQAPGGYDDQQRQGYPPQGGPQGGQQYGAPPQHGQPYQQAPQPDPFQQQAPQPQAPHQPPGPPGQPQDPWGVPQQQPGQQQHGQQQHGQQQDGWGAPPVPDLQGQPQQGQPQHGQPQYGQPPGQQQPGQQFGGQPQQDQWGPPQQQSSDPWGMPQQQAQQPQQPQQDQWGPPQPQQQFPPQQDQFPPQQREPQYPPQDQFQPQQDQYGMPQQPGPGDQGFGAPPPPRGGGQPPMPPPHGREATLLPPDQNQGRPQADPGGTAFMCPYCEAVLSNPGAAQCDSCLRPLPQKGTPVLRVQFPTGELKVSVGQHLVLGRDAGQSPVASTFTQYDNVSRRHSTVWLDPSGTAWVRDEGSTNGTFVNGERLPRGVEAPLRDGDQLRLAADVTGTVQLK